MLINLDELYKEWEGTPMSWENQCHHYSERSPGERLFCLRLKDHKDHHYYDPIYANKPIVN